MITKEQIEAFGAIETPFYFYDLDLLRKTLDIYKAQIDKYGYNAHYALKANANDRILAIIKGYGLGADCVSGNEVKLAVRSGFDPQKIVYAGVGKSDKEIKAALRAGIFSFNCESVPEIRILNDLAETAQDRYNDPSMEIMYDESEPIPEGPSCQALAELARTLSVYVCFGMAERGDQPGRFYNAVVLMGPDGYVGSYRKCTIGPLGSSPIQVGMPLPKSAGRPVFDTDIGRVGIQLSRDLEYEEITWLLAHDGAQIVASPNYWPNDTGEDEDESHLRRQKLLVERSKENGVVIVDANRCGAGLDGRSMVAVPYSDEPISSTGPGEGIALATVQLY